MLPVGRGVWFWGGGFLLGVGAGLVFFGGWGGGGGVGGGVLVFFLDAIGNA